MFKQNEICRIRIRLFISRSDERSRENYEHSSKRGYIYKKIAYYFDEGYIIMKCDSWDKDTGIKDGLVFDIYTKKLSKFLNEKAY